MVNDIIWREIQKAQVTASKERVGLLREDAKHPHNMRAIKKAQVPASREPVGMSREDAKRPDGATLIHWARSKPMAWDVTVPDTYAQSHLDSTSQQAGAAADNAAYGPINNRAPNSFKNLAAISEP